MRIGRTVIASLTVAAILMAGAASAFCTPSTHGVMKCCKPARPCGPGMKQADCCRFVPASTGQVPVAVETALQSKVSRDEMKGAVLAEILGGASLSAKLAPQASPPPLLQRGLSVPLYILNTSLLR